jgi:hypothetical protein
MVLAPLDWRLLLFTAVLSFVWAMMEIQIEGPDGWARNLPTWRLAKHPWLNFIYGGAEITGYHVWAFGGIFLFFHIPFVWNASWTWRGEAHIVGAFALFWVLEDYLWFVFNPHFGWRGLRPDKALWHRRWLWGFPVNYYISGIAGLLLFLIR